MVPVHSLQFLSCEEQFKEFRVKSSNFKISFILLYAPNQNTYVFPQKLKADLQIILQPPECFAFVPFFKLKPPESCTQQRFDPGY